MGCADAYDAVPSGGEAFFGGHFYGGGVGGPYHGMPSKGNDSLRLRQDGIFSFRGQLHPSLKTVAVRAPFGPDLHRGGAERAEPLPLGGLDRSWAFRDEDADCCHYESCDSKGQAPEIDEWKFQEIEPCAHGCYQ